MKNQSSGAKTVPKRNSCEYLLFTGVIFLPAFDLYDRVVRVLGIETVDTAVQQYIQNEKVLEEKRRMEQMPKGNIHERLAWGMKKSEMENQQRKKTKSKNREMER